MEGGRLKATILLWRFGFYHSWLKFQKDYKEHMTKTSSTVKPGVVVEVVKHEEPASVGEDEMAKRFKLIFVSYFRYESFFHEKKKSSKHALEASGAAEDGAAASIDGQEKKKKKKKLSADMSSGPSVDGADGLIILPALEKSDKKKMKMKKDGKKDNKKMKNKKKGPKA